METTELAELKTEILKLHEKLDKMDAILNKTNSVLVNHINFITGIYAGIKRPLTYIMNRINNLFLSNE